MCLCAHIHVCSHVSMCVDIWMHGCICAYTSSEDIHLFNICHQVCRCPEASISFRTLLRHAKFKTPHLPTNLSHPVHFWVDDSDGQQSGHSYEELPLSFLVFPHFWRLMLKYSKFISFSCEILNCKKSVKHLWILYKLYGANNQSQIRLNLNISHYNL